MTADAPQGAGEGAEDERLYSLRPSDAFTIKVQAPFESNTPNAPVFVYNRDRSVETYFPFDEFWQTALHGRQKAYFLARFMGEQMEIGQEVPAEKW